jgi:hypothetical protein
LFACQAGRNSGVHCIHLHIYTHDQSGARHKILTPTGLGIFGTAVSSKNNTYGMDEQD